MTEENRKELHLPVSLTVADVSALKDSWIALTDDATDLTINARNVQQADSAGMQLLLAATTRIRGKEGLVSWSNTSDTLDNIAAILGMTNELGLRT